MPKEHTDFRHPLHDRIAELIRDGLDNTAIELQTGVNRRQVARVRDLMGLPPSTRGTTRLTKVQRFSVALDGDHVGWTGRRATSGAPVIRHRGTEVPASHVVFEQRAGRPPVGIVKPECGMDDCLNGAHVGDELERRDIRGQERTLHGLDPVPWDVCPAGTHYWPEAGRFEPNLTPYCKACNTERAARRRLRLARQRAAD